MVQQYIYLNMGTISATGWFHVVDSIGNPCKAGTLQLGPDELNFRARDLSPTVYEKIQSLSYSMLEDLMNLIFDKFLYRICNKWPKLDKLLFWVVCPPFMFATFPLSITEALNIAEAQSSQLKTYPG